MLDSTTRFGRVRELDSRDSDGIHVRLLWHPVDDQVSVSVSDGKTGERFELPVRPGERALEVFRHPYAYAACHDHRPCGQAGSSLAA